MFDFASVNPTSKPTPSLRRRVSQLREPSGSASSAIEKRTSLTLVPLSSRRSISPISQRPRVASVSTPRLQRGGGINGELFFLRTPSVATSTPDAIRDSPLHSRQASSQFLFPGAPSTTKPPTATVPPQSSLTHSSRIAPAPPNLIRRDRHQVEPDESPGSQRRPRVPLALPPVPAQLYHLQNPHEVFAGGENGYPHQTPSSPPTGKTTVLKPSPRPPLTSTTPRRISATHLSPLGKSPPAPPSQTNVAPSILPDREQQFSAFLSSSQPASPRGRTASTNQPDQNLPKPPYNLLTSASPPAQERRSGLARSFSGASAIRTSRSSSSSLSPRQTAEPRLTERTVFQHSAPGKISFAAKAAETGVPLSSSSPVPAVSKPNIDRPFSVSTRLSDTEGGHFRNQSSYDASQAFDQPVEQTRENDHATPSVHDRSQPLFSPLRAQNSRILSAVEESLGLTSTAGLLAANAEDPYQRYMHKVSQLRSSESLPLSITLPSRVLSARKDPALPLFSREEDIYTTSCAKLEKLHQDLKDQLTQRYLSQGPYNNSSHGFRKSGANDTRYPAVSRCKSPSGNRDSVPSFVSSLFGDAATTQGVLEDSQAQGHLRLRPLDPEVLQEMRSAVARVADIADGRHFPEVNPITDRDLLHFLGRLHWSDIYAYQQPQHARRNHPYRFAQTRKRY